MTKGPVPFVCNEAWLGDVAEAGVGSEELFASAHFLSMMYQVAHWANKMGIGRGEHEIDRVVVDFDDLGIHWHAGLHVGAFGPDPDCGKHDVVGREVVAVVEFHAAPQVKAPPGRFWRFPALGQCRDNVQVLVTSDQPFVNMAEMGECGDFIEAYTDRATSGRPDCRIARSAPIRALRKNGRMTFKAKTVGRNNMLPLREMHATRWSGPSRSVTSNYVR